MVHFCSFFGAQQPLVTVFSILQSSLFVHSRWTLPQGWHINPCIYMLLGAVNAGRFPNWLELISAGQVIPINYSWTHCSYALLEQLTLSLSLCLQQPKCISLTYVSHAHKPWGDVCTKPQTVYFFLFVLCFPTKTFGFEMLSILPLSTAKFNNYH